MGTLQTAQEGAVRIIRRAQVRDPPIAVRRIDRYDGQRVTYHYRSHRTERVEHETVAVDTFIGHISATMWLAT
jgi:hypothetical protein